MRAIECALEIQPAQQPRGQQRAKRIAERNTCIQQGRSVNSKVGNQRTQKYSRPITVAQTQKSGNRYSGGEPDQGDVRTNIGYGQPQLCTGKVNQCNKQYCGNKKKKRLVTCFVSSEYFEYSNKVHLEIPGNWFLGL